MKQELPTPSPQGPSQPPDFKQIRKYLRTIQHREALRQFITAGWTPIELGEFAYQVFLAPGKTYPTAASYQHAMEKGPKHSFAKETLAALRAPGFAMRPFSRPVPKEFAWDDPDNSDHTREIRADVEVIAKLYRTRQACWLARPRPHPDEPIPRSLWKRCYRLRNRYHSLEDTLEIQGLRGYAEDRLVPLLSD
jgi:hypothetical protein